MKTKSIERKGVKKTVLMTTMVIGTSTLLSMGILQAATATEFKKTNTIPTNYANLVEDASQIVQNSFPEGYEQANYTIETIDLEYYRNQTPTGKDMSREETAEIGAQALWEVFDVNLEGQVIEMGYQQAVEGLPRSTWNADIWVGDDHSYHFSVDSVTGELFSIDSSRIVNSDTSIAFDAALDKNPQEFIMVARELAEQFNVVHGAVKSVEYNGQGYSDNDPTISFDIMGENGEVALMTLSRYDKELLGINYSASYKYTLEYNEELQKNLQKKVKEGEKFAPSIDENDTSTLKSIDLDGVGDRD
ncbi:hypothetical protein [Sporosarcina newyorkensis]|uniref:Peptidase propeptide and YPEB domain-containing protein n=1 Tax=Sporosarcina newyorkensis TaxID=759851 RepID=A0A1T4YPM2_9BACL|nr:hypothetical protein [Sporosarcina newyorkensis]SKB03643.1 hypothetical protein SAMN04244570_3229 [Sporosarcina newyorkensis]